MSEDLDLDAFCHAQFPRLVRLLALHCGDPELARDLAQETLVKVCLHWRTVRRLDVPEAWVTRVAINQSVSTLRKQVTRSRTVRLLQDSAPPPARQLDADVVAGAEIRAVLAELPERQRAALILRFFCDQTVEQSAATLGVSPSAVKKLTAKGLDQLRRRLGEVTADMPGGDPR